jgi:hypothetical protein
MSRTKAIIIFGSVALLLIAGAMTMEFVKLNELMHEHTVIKELLSHKLLNDQGSISIGAEELEKNDMYAKEVLTYITDVNSSDAEFVAMQDQLNLINEMAQRGHWLNINIILGIGLAVVIILYYAGSTVGFKWRRITLFTSIALILIILVPSIAFVAHSHEITGEADKLSAEYSNEVVTSIFGDSVYTKLSVDAYPAIATSAKLYANTLDKYAVEALVKSIIQAIFATILVYFYFCGVARRELCE